MGKWIVLENFYFLWIQQDWEINRGENCIILPNIFLGFWDFSALEGTELWNKEALDDKKLSTYISFRVRQER